MAMWCGSIEAVEDDVWERSEEETLDDYFVALFELIIF